jgi:hypothetical protein
MAPCYIPLGLMLLALMRGVVMIGGITQIVMMYIHECIYQRVASMGGMVTPGILQRYKNVAL